MRVTLRPFLLNMIYTILSGSSRKNSSSLRVAKAIKRILEEKNAGKINLVSFEHYDIPFMNGISPAPDNLTPFQQELVDAMTAADSIIMVTPEYNWFPSAEMVNLVHQLGDRQFTSIWDKKVFSFVGVSSGRGGRIPTVQLGYVVGKILNVLHLDSITNPKSMEVQFTSRVLDENGQSTGNEELDNGLHTFADYAVRLSEKWVK